MSEGVEGGRGADESTTPPEDVSSEEERRSPTEDRSETRDEQKEESESGVTSGEEQIEVPPASFISLVVSLATSAVAHLGFMPDPVSGKTVQHLEMARHDIDLLGILREKTAGNLEAEEERLLEEILSDLRLKFVRIREERGSSSHGEGGGDA